MPALSFPTTDYQAFQIIKASELNGKLSAIRTLLNTTKLDDDNIQDAGITRSTKLSAGTADHVIINAGDGTMSSEAQLASSRGGTGQDFSASTGVVKVSSGTMSAGSVDVSTGDITGTLPIANGGTGQTSAAAAFDALAPTTTKGDLIIHNGTDNIRQAVGSDGAVLVASSGSASGVAWGAAPAAPTGATLMWWSSTAPSSWLLLNGDTLGSVSSGATHTGTTYQALFEYFWDNVDNTELPIQDSSGVPTTRGADAASDFAANKRLPIPNTTGLVPRSPGTQAIGGRNKTGPTVGGTQEDQFQGHKFARNGTDSSSDFWHSNASNGSATHVWRSSTGHTGAGLAIVEYASNGTPRFGTETRASAFGVYFIVKI